MSLEIDHSLLSDLIKEGKLFWGGLKRTDVYATKFIGENLHDIARSVEGMGHSISKVLRKNTEGGNLDIFTP